MRHRNKKTKLGRKTAHRSSLLANLACSLIEHKRINTTLTKAKVLKRFIEPLITKTKDDSTHNRRIVFRYLMSSGSRSSKIIPEKNSKTSNPFVVSFHNKSGQDLLIKKLIELMSFINVTNNDVRLTRSWHKTVCLTVCNALERAITLDSKEHPEIVAEELRLACNALGRLTGQVAVDDLLDNIFSNWLIFILLLFFFTKTVRTWWVSCILYGEAKKTPKRSKVASLGTTRY